MLGLVRDFPLGLRQFGLEQVGGAHRDDGLVAERLLADSLIDGPGRPAVEAFQVVLRFGGDHLVAFAGQHVQGRLRAHDLARRRHQRRVAEVLAHARDLFEHRLHLVQRVLLGELRSQVRQHPAGNLGEQDFGIHPGKVAFELVVLLASHAQDLGDGR